MGLSQIVPGPTDQVDRMLDLIFSKGVDVILIAIAEVLGSDHFALKCLYPNPPVQLAGKIMFAC